MQSHSLQPLLQVVQLLAGEKPKGMDAEHYIDVKRLAEQQYSRYFSHIRKLLAHI